MPLAPPMAFSGADEAGHVLLFKGPLGKEYRLHPSALPTQFAGITCGTFLTFRRGPYQGRTLTAVGVSKQSGELFVYDRHNHCGYPIHGANSAEALADAHDALPTTSAQDAGFVAPRTVAGPLQLQYTVETDAETMADVFGLTAGTPLHVPSSTNALSGVVGDCAAVGEAFGSLWVAATSHPRLASPLPGATNEKALLTLYRAKDRDTASGVNSPRVPVTPGRTGRRAGSVGPSSRAMTPGRDAGGVLADAVFKLSSDERFCLCRAAFGNNAKVAADKRSMSDFSVEHGQRLHASKGGFDGQTCTVLGVKAGVLYVVFDGDERASILLNCTNAADLQALHGFPVTVPPGQKVSAAAADALATAAESVAAIKKSPSRGRSAEPASPFSRGGGSPSSRDAHSPARKTMIAPRQCWTAHGRHSFDTAPAAVQHFGFSHGDVVMATKGLDRGRKFRVFGARLGLLWVVPEGRARATGLRHCSTKQDVEHLYGFEKLGHDGCDDVAQIESEPPMTPRSSITSPHMRSPEDSGIYSASPASALRGSATAPIAASAGASPHAHGAPFDEASVTAPADAKPRPAVVPVLPLGQPSPPAATPSRELDLSATRGTAASDLSPNGQPREAIPGTWSPAADATATATPASTTGTPAPPNAPMPGSAAGSPPKGGHATRSGAAFSSLIADPALHSYDPMAAVAAAADAESVLTAAELAVQIERDVAVKVAAAKEAAAAESGAATGMPGTRVFLKAFALWRERCAGGEAEHPLAFRDYYTADPRRLSRAMRTLPLFIQFWERSAPVPGVSFHAASADAMRGALDIAPATVTAAAQ